MISEPRKGMPPLGSGITWCRDNHRVMASPHLKEGELSVIDTKPLEITRILRPVPGATLAPVEFTRPG